MIAAAVEGHPEKIIALVLVLTFVFAFFLRNAVYETDIVAFLPDNEEVRAQDRIYEYFGRDAYVHMVYISGENVLSPRALREQYNITLAAGSVDGVVGTVGLAPVVNELCHYIFDPMTFSYHYNPNRTLLNTPDEQIRARVSILRDILTGEIDPSEFSHGAMDLRPADLRFFFGLLMSDDFDLQNMTATGTLLLVELDGNLTRSQLRDVVGEVKDAISNVCLRAVEESETSEYYIAHEMEETIYTTMAVLGLSIIFLVTLVLWGSFRHLSYVWAPMLTLIVAIIWTFSTMVLLGTTFSILDVAVIPLVVGLGVDYSVHLSRRYHEHLREGLPIKEAVGKSIKRVGAALFLAFITTVAAFMSNLISEIPPIRDFGVMCALGVAYSFILALTFYSSIRILVDRRRGPHAARPRPTPVMDGIMRKMADVVEERPRAISVAAVLLVVGGFYAGTMVPVEFNLEKFLPSDWESISTASVIKERFSAGQFSTVYVLVEGDDLARPEVLSAIFDTEDNTHDDRLVVAIEDPATGNTSYYVESIASLVRKAVEENSTLAARFNLSLEGRPLPNCTESDLRGLYAYLSSNTTTYDIMRGTTFAEQFRRVIYHSSGTPDGAYTATVLRINVKAATDQDNMEIKLDMEKDIAPLKSISGTRTYLTGGVILVQGIIDQLSWSQIESTVVSSLFALFILSLIYRSPVLGLVSMIPVTVTMSLTLGTMYILGIPLNALTIMVTALTIGLGIDYAVHVVERFREEEKRFSPSRALHRTLENTGAALFISALTTMLGFGVLVIARIPVFVDFGIITAAMIAYSLLSAALITPVPLMYMARRRLRKQREKNTESEGPESTGPGRETGGGET